MKSYIKNIVLFLVCLVLAITLLRSDVFCEFTSINLNNIYNFAASPRGLYFAISVLLAYFAIYQYSCNSNKPIQQEEPFEVMLADNWSDGIKRLDLRDFFTFAELFMVNDLDPANSMGNLVCKRRDEKIVIRNAIDQILRNLHFVINVNKKDNFYSRFLVAKVGSSLYQHDIRPQRRRNYDEMVRDNIGKQFTFMPETALDRYYPRPNLDSRHQEPLPMTINVHNYYTYTNTPINLLALKMILETVQEKNHASFGLIVRPSEHMAFEEEFMIPMQSVIRNIVDVTNTQTFAEYMTTQMRLP